MAVPARIYNSQVHTKPVAKKATNQFNSVETGNRYSEPATAANDNRYETVDQTARKRGFGKDSISKSAEQRAEKKQASNKAFDTARDTILKNPVPGAGPLGRTSESVADILHTPVVTLKIVRALALVWFILLPLYFIQIVGGGITIFALLAYYGIEAIPVLGEFFASNSGALELYEIGTDIVMLAGFLTYLLVIILLMIQRVPIFTWPSLLVMVVSFCLLVIPGFNLLPVIAIWLLFIVYT